MKRHSFFFAVGLSAFLAAPGAFAQSKTAEVINYWYDVFEDAPHWNSKDKKLGDDWKAKIDQKLANAEFVQKVCGKGYADLKNASYSATLGSIERREKLLENICYSELVNGNYLAELTESFKAKYSDSVLHFYIAANERGFAVLHYYYPSYVCSVNGVKTETELRNQLSIHFGVSSETSLERKNTGTACASNQPLGAKTRLGIDAGFTKPVEKEVEKKVKDKNSVVDLPDLNAWFKDVKPKVPPLDELERVLRRQLPEYERTLTLRPVFDVPGEKEDNFAFVIDKTGSFSRSRNGVKATEKGSFADALDDLAESIRNYPEDKSFSLALFGTVATLGKTDKDKAAMTKDMYNGGKLIKATGQNKAAAIEWVMEQKREALEQDKIRLAKGKGYVPVRNEYAAEVLEKIQATNPGAAVNYRYYGDGRVSIGSDKESGGLSDDEKKRQVAFVKNLPSGSKFAFSPMSSDYNPEFSKLLGEKAEFVDPSKRSAIPSKELFAQQKEAKARYQEIKQAMDTVIYLKGALATSVPLEALYQEYKAKGWQVKDKYQLELGKLTAKWNELEPIIQKLGPKLGLSPTALGYQFPKSRKFYLGYKGEADVYIDEKVCK